MAKKTEVVQMQKTVIRVTVKHGADGNTVTKMVNITGVAKEVVRPDRIIQRGGERHG